MSKYTEQQARELAAKRCPEAAEEIRTKSLPDLLVFLASCYAMQRVFIRCVPEDIQRRIMARVERMLNQAELQAKSKAN